MGAIKPTVHPIPASLSRANPLSLPRLVTASRANVTLPAHHGCPTCLYRLFFSAIRLYIMPQKESLVREGVGLGAGRGGHCFDLLSTALPFCLCRQTRTRQRWGQRQQPCPVPPCTTSPTGPAPLPALPAALNGAPALLLEPPPGGARLWPTALGPMPRAWAPRPQHPHTCLPALVTQTACRHATDPAYYSDERCLRITDIHPKARLHVLVVARDPRLGGPLDLTSQDMPVLEHMLVRYSARARDEAGGQPVEH